MVNQETSSPREAQRPELAGLHGSASLTTVAAQILLAASRQRDPGRFLRDALDTVAAAAESSFAALAVFTGGRWKVLSERGPQTALPFDWLSDVLDREAASEKAPWVAAPLRSGAAGGELLVVHGAPHPKAAVDTLAALAPVIAQALDTVRMADREGRRRQRLEAILEIAGRWYQTREMEPLLVLMAEAATKLLSADRASIFLWDRANHTLVGRPALGVAGGELRVPDDTGLVGRVIRAGVPMRVDLDRDQQVIDRRVDTTLGYQTRTLLCVPLRGRTGELFGAFETINKSSGNFSDEDEEALEELATHAAIALENTQEFEHLLRSRRQMSEQAASGVQLIGSSPAIEALRSTVRRVADTELAVLVLGENGTGKEVVSQTIHYLSGRRDHPFIAVNCAALTETLLESELFGHEKGAFTDAHEARPGKFELASGGTLFLDEIGDLSLGGQSKLLRVLEEKVVVRVGGSKSIPTDTRVVAATNQDLAEMVKSKRFRQDLYFRLNVVTLHIPPLRERQEDIMLLAQHFLTTFCKQARRKPPKISDAARRRLETHPWPGNVRELRNVMERLAYLNSGDRIEVEDLAFMLAGGDDAGAQIAGDLTLSDGTSQFQTRYIEQAIRRCGGNMSRAAQQLGLHRSNLYRKMRQLGMNVEED